MSSERQNSPNELIEHRKTEVANDETGERATLHLAIFRNSAATLRLVDQPAERRDLAAVMTDLHALAGVNGGYFDPQDAPVGLLVSAGKTISPLSRAKLLSGVLFAEKDSVEIVRAAHFKMNRAVAEAVQCGPLLVERGEPVPGLNDTRSARRTFAAIDGRKSAALGYCSGVSLAEMARVLCLTNIAGEVKFARALNLDGGSSSAFWVAGGADISEQKTVRDFVAIVPRSTR